MLEHTLFISLTNTEWLMNSKTLCFSILEARKDFFGSFRVPVPAVVDPGGGGVLLADGSPCELTWVQRW